jgi:hypothetical protein
MDIKIKAFELFQLGVSYKEIANRLNIGKTTAYDYVKEMKLIKIPLNSSLPKVPNGSELIRNGDSERKNEQNKIPAPKEGENLEIAGKKKVPNVPNTKKIKIITGDELLKLKFDVLPFTGKFLELIGKPERGFSGIVFGKPKGGKSNFAIRFADYLQEYFGKTVYVASEEGSSLTLQDKIKEINGSKITFIETRNREELRDFLKGNQVDFLFIDSINTLNIDDEYLELLKYENACTSFVAIIQATKEGNFKGAQSLEHNCDFVIRVEKGVAYHRGRFGPESELTIFGQSLYEKNKTKLSEPKIGDSNPIFPLPKSLPIPNKFGRNESKLILEKLSDLKLDLTIPTYSKTDRKVDSLINQSKDVSDLLKLKSIPTKSSSGIGRFVTLLIAGAIIINAIED